LVGLTNVSTTVVNTSNVSANTSLLLQTNGTTTAVTIDTSQNVQLGLTTNPQSSRLTVQGAASSIADFESTITTTSGGGIRVSNSGTTELWIGYYQFASNMGAGVTDAGLSARNNLLLDGTNAILFGQNGTEKARFDSSGNLLVGQTSASQTTVGFFAKPNGEVSGCQSASTNGGGTQWNTYSTGAGAFRFYVGMGGTVFATSTTISGISDQRLKENIRDLDDGLDVVMALKPRKFDWKEGKGADIKNARGFIAQEFEQVLPDMIDEWKDPAPEGEEPYKAVNANLIPTLVKAIQEQQAMITNLQAQVTTLQTQVTALQSKVGV